jgi:predicted kinase
MEAVLFVGVQGSGKSTFYQQRFFHTHVRISLDLLRTRHRERQFLEACLRTQQPFVVDKTNPTKKERQPYIEAAKAARFRVVGYYFQSSVEECKERNAGRQGKHVVPLVGLLGTYKKLQLPGFEEGFDQLFYVRIEDGQFVVEEWRDEVR